MLFSVMGGVEKVEGGDSVAGGGGHGHTER